MTARQLIEYARTYIKNECPKVTQSDREIWINAGKNEAIEMLERKLKSIEDDGLLMNSVFKTS